MNAPLPHPVVKESLITDGVNHPEIPDGSTVVDIDIDMLDPHKVATDPRFVIRNGLNVRRW